MSTPNNGRPYAPEEDDLIKAGWGRRPLAEIARDLGRHAGSVSSRATTLGLTSHGDAIHLGQRATIDANRRFEQHFTRLARQRGWMVHSFKLQAAGAGA